MYRFVMGIFLIFSVLFSVSWAKSPSKTIIGKPLPDSIVFTTLQGEPVDVIKGRGRYVINYWASWCLPCAKELPIFQSMIPSLERLGITPVLINVDRRPARQAPKALAKWGITQLTSYAGDMYQAFKVFNVQGIPIVVTIDNGKVVDIMDLNIHQWDKQGSVEYFKQVLGIR